MAGAGSRRVPMGRVARPFGIRGEVRVKPYNPQSPNWANLRVVLLRGEQGEEEVEILRARPHQGYILLSLKGVQSREDLERLRGLEVLARAEDLKPLDEGEYYWDQLIGLEVWCEGRRLGPVIRMEATAPELDGADLLVVASGGKEALIPFAAKIIRGVDLVAGRIEVNPFQGLWDDPV
jgi:16S rRNA processing protein RimM